jgi:hypothetical protein
MARLFFVLYLFGLVFAAVLAVGLWQSGADQVAWNGWAVVALLCFARALQCGDRT